MPIALASARQLGLLVTRTDNETMVFDTETNQLHHLNPLATAVWAQLDGTRSATTIAEAVSASLNETISTEAVTESIRLLSEAGLLEAGWSDGAQPGSRRAFLRRAAVVGAASIPVVMSITAPSAAMARSDSICGQQCNSDRDCPKKCDDCEYRHSLGYKICVDD